jgi:hypothetical protein
MFGHAITEVRGMATRKNRSADATRLTPGKARNAIAVVKVVAPAVLPIVVPFVSRTAGTVRNRWDRLRAQRLGIAIEELATYSGRGGGLHARIAGAAASLADLAQQPDPDGSFATATETRLRQLTAVVRAAERMPSTRRRAAHRAVAADLDRIEREILRRLGV